MTTDQTIALFTSIAACLSAIATFWTVLQIKKQREASYRPELVFSRSSFTAVEERDGGMRLLTRWIADESFKPSASLKTGKPLLIPLRNVGLGAAKDLKIEWSFPLEQTVEHINKVAQRTLTPAYFRVNEWGVTFESEALGKSMSMWKNQKKVALDFVLPAAVEEESVTLALPHAYVLLCSALMFFDWKDKDARDSPRFEMPALRATISYSDIANAHHRMVFELFPQISMISENEFNGLFVCTKIK